jgi:TolB-like protein
VSLLVASASVSAAERPRIAAVPAQLDANAAAQLDKKMLDEVVLAALARGGSLDVIGQSDIEALISFERQKELVGCDDVKCFAEIGGALGVGYLLSLRVTLSGNEWALAAKLIDTQAGRVLTRSSDFVPGSANDLLRAVPGLVDKLLSGSGEPALATRTATSAASGGAPGSAGVAFKSDNFNGALEVTLFSENGTKHSCATQAASVQACDLGNVPPGKVKVEVRGGLSLNDVVALGPGAQTLVVSERPFYGSPWFWAGIPLIAVGTFVATWRLSHSEDLLTSQTGDLLIGLALIGGGLAGMTWSFFRGPTVDVEPASPPATAAHGFGVGLSPAGVAAWGSF